MAIEYGAYSGRARFGIDTWYTGDPNSGTVTVEWRVYLQTDRGSTPGYSGTYNLVRTGNSVPGSGNVSVYTSGQTPQLLWSGSQSVATSYTGTTYRDLGVYFTAALFDGSAPSHARGITIPARAPNKPSQPTSATRTYVSDNRIDIAWTRPGNWSDPAYIWHNVAVNRYHVDTGWVNVGWLSGSATSFSDTSAQPDKGYNYAVHAVNSTDWSDPTFTGDIFTTPDAPSAVSAAKNAAGDIVVTWTDNSQHETSFDIYDNGTAGANKIGSVGGGVTTYTHVSPNPSVTHTYRVVSLVPGPRQSAFSAASNTVQLQAAPAAPTNLSPNGIAVAREEAIVLTWTHNPVDSTPQTAYEIETRPSGGTWTSLGVVNSATSSHTIAANTWAAGVREWRVRTKGAHASYSPYSAVATITLTTRPTANITAPGATVVTPSTTVTWGYFHATSSPQSAWQGEIVVNGQVVATGTNSGTGTSWATGNVLPNGSSATARIRVREANGLWSAWATKTFTVNYSPPAQSLVTAAWQDGLGFARVSAQAVTEAGKPATVSHTIERSDDGQVTWQTLITGLAPSVEFVDWTAPAGGTYHYRVTAYSASPSSASTIVAVTVADVPLNDTIWVSGGPGFNTVLALPYSPDVDASAGRTRSLVDFDGRTHPVEMTSRRKPYVLGVKAELPPDDHTVDPARVASASRTALEALFEMPGPHLYRDPSGRTVVGSVSALTWGRTPGGRGSVSFSITRTAKPTVDQAAALARYYDNEGWTEL